MVSRRATTAWPSASMMHVIDPSNLCVANAKCCSCDMRKSSGHPLSHLILPDVCYGARSSGVAGCRYSNGQRIHTAITRVAYLYRDDYLCCANHQPSCQIKAASQVNTAFIPAITASHVPASLRKHHLTTVQQVAAQGLVCR